MRPLTLAAYLGTSAVLTGLHGCARDVPTKTVDVLAASEAGNIEGEVFGNIWQNGARATGTGYYVTLDPFDPVTQSRLRSPHSITTWADPQAGTTGHGKWMLEWSDPADGGQCGGLSSYLAGDTLSRLNEAHWPGPGQPPQGKERHCARPGTYTFAASGPGLNKTFRVDYVPLALGSGGAPRTVNNTTANVTEWLESFSYDDASGNPVHDLIMHVDLTPNGYSDAPLLDVENALGDSIKPTFANQANPGGTELDLFRFSAARSSSTWNVSPGGKMLSRSYWDLARNPSQASNYFNAHAPGYVIRQHRFVSHVDSSRDVIVALELMRPDEPPNDTLNTARRTIAITRTTPVACATFERTTTWRLTDQYLSAGCSTRGPNIQYRWQLEAGSAWGPYSVDTLYDFLGHYTAGAKQVILEARNTSTGGSAFDTTTLSVQSGQIVLTGQTYITVKTTYTYTSSLFGTWYERYNPSLTWVQGISGTSMNRVWPAGAYTRELRQDSSTSALLRRGRLSIQVCIPPSSCGGPALVLEGSAPSAVVADTGWSLFGGGPWLSWGSGAGAQALRLYDLLGEHDGATGFTSPTWLADPTGSSLTLPAGWTLEWRRRNVGLADVQAFDVSISGAGGPYTFGFALDPDIGPNPADDLSSYDAARGLVTARDGAQAVGYLLRGPTTNVLASIQQYGVDRWAPTTPAAAAQAQRQPSTRLLTGPRDVQFVLSAAETTGPTTYTLVLIRGRNVPDLQTKADAVIAVLDQ